MSKTVGPVAIGRKGSPFGPRGELMHYGQDYITPDGESVYACIGGTVISNGAAHKPSLCDDGRGVMVASDEYIVYYGNVTSRLRLGQKVVEGEYIGTVEGMLHIEVMVDNVFIDPLLILDKARVSRSKSLNEQEPMVAPDAVDGVVAEQVRVIQDTCNAYPGVKLSVDGVPGKKTKARVRSVVKSLRSKGEVVPAVLTGETIESL